MAWLSGQYRTELTMDLGIKGRHALVCAASKGLGKGCAMALAREGVNVTITARTQADLEQTAEEIRREAPDVTVTAVVGDITTPEGRAAALATARNPTSWSTMLEGRPGRLPRLVAGGLDPGTRGQHAYPDRADQSHSGRHDGAELWADCEHHLERGESAH